jgi:lactoylglutathione lyase
MNFTMVHNNINVFDLEKSIKFYEDALGLKIAKTKESPTGAFKIVYLKDDYSSHLLELTWLKEKTTPYNLGDNEIHLCFKTDNYDQAYLKHKEMGCICYENKEMGLYFIADPDGYWLEILRNKK